KRLVPGYEAPVYIGWARINRSALIRIPQISKGQLDSTRIELRCPDPSSNPYLAFAPMLAAGLDGIERKLAPPGPVEEKLYPLDQGLWGPTVRITHLRDALARRVAIDVVDGYRARRRGALARYALSGQMRVLDGIYVETSTALPSETDVAFLALARALGVPIL